MQLSQTQKYAAVFIAALIFFLGGWYFFSFIPHKGESVAVTPDLTSETGRPQTTATPARKTITFDISGAVLRPGIYTLSEGSRIADALKSAGGALPEADMPSVNLAHKIHDEEKIFIPALKPKPAASSGKDLGSPEPAELQSRPDYKVEEELPETPAATREHTRINLNSASLEDLEKLPGVGEKTAAKIIEYRNTKGNFNSPEELRKIPGIGPAKLNRIRHYLDY
jgi:competence protein ComEA